ncbi:4615_t:CDS:1 [Funneliformis mosseae]|uniref:4615_t:CDS:1 n=1 Tax=Funneliformis mosseae TaxID=27381 RepID=A0A9N9AUU5_FUNMO|nr:4615_t:CDS:1 [Funneliformis mosseae]
MYRKDMMKHKPHNMPMTKFSKLVSEWWKKLPVDEKANRDQTFRNEINVRAISSQSDVSKTREDKINQDYRDHIEPSTVTDSLSECNHQKNGEQTINEANNLPMGMKRDCYLTESPSGIFIE